MTRLVLWDYGSGNLRSAQRALERVGAQVEVGADPRSALAADGMVVPGVGAFAACMAGLAASGGGAVVRERAAAGRPVFGICVGLQMLFAWGEEHGQRTDGLGMLAGGVSRLSAPIIPHMGWNTVCAPGESMLFGGIAAERFYFVHSYAATSVSESAATVTWALHGERFVAAVESGAVSGTQFHPEKSGEAGLALLENWVASLP